MRPSPSAPFAWTPQRRAALRMALEGLSQAAIAKRLGVHRHTLQNWSRQQEWVTEMRARLDERTTSARFRRIHAVEKLTDRLTEMAEDALDADTIHVSAAGLFLRELREYHRLEREQVGPTQPASAPSPADRALVVQGSERSLESAKVLNQSFRQFLRDHLADVSRAALDARSPQEALILATQDILMAHPEILDAAHAADAANAHQFAARRLADTRRR